MNNTEFNHGFMTLREKMQKKKKRGGGEVVLLVDDDYIIVRTVSKLLRREGYEPINTYNAEEVLRIFSKAFEKISVVVVDINLPDMAGTELVKRLREIDPEVKLIIASGMNPEELMDEDVLMDLELLTKPFNVKQLTHAIQKLLK